MEKEPQDAPDSPIEEVQAPTGDYVERYPHASVIQSWRNLEIFAFQLLPALGVPSDANTTLRDLFVRAKQKGILGDRELALVFALQEVRDRVIHGPNDQVKVEDVHFYVNRVAETLTALSEAASAWSEVN